MALTLLFDLDDTLLGTNLDAFVPAYFQALANHLAPYVSPEVMLPALMSGTQRMMASKDPTRTLREVFDAEFYPRLGLPAEDLREALEKFYDDVFPSLGKLTRQKPGATSMIRWGIEKGYRISIATDPFFPLKGTKHRVRWADLDPEAFELISSFETFHFSKSHPAYYAEFLARLGWPDGPILMVGNDVERDLIPAQQLGLATFQVNGDPASSRKVEADGYGSLSDLRHWLESVNLKSLEPKFKNVEAFLALMMSTPAALSSLTKDIPPSLWIARPAPTEWSLTEVLCHLRDTEREIHAPHLQMILTQSDPFLSQPDTHAWAEARGYLSQDGILALGDFITARLDALARLKDLPLDHWSRKARHSVFGPTNMQETIAFITQHDRLHIQQIWKILHKFPLVHSA